MNRISVAMKHIILLIATTIGFTRILAQDYHAITGSNYAGALSVHNNPASIVNVPYPWDITLAGLQAKYQTNVIRVVNYSLLSSPASSEFFISSGSFARKGNEQLNLNLLNTRLAVGKKTVLALGANLRSFANISTSSYNYSDSIETVNELFALNPGNTPLEARMRTSSWVELYGAIGRTLFDEPGFRINAGLTMKVNRGIGGARLELDGMYRDRTIVNGTPQYALREGQFAYGYSSTIDRWNSGRTTTENLREVLTASRMGLSLDAGLELLIKPQGEPGFMEDEETYYDYDWKIGASLLDLGYAFYAYSNNSRAGRIPVTGLDADRLDQAFLESIPSMEAFSDSVQAVFDARRLSGEFRIWAPTRLVLNVDRFINSAFYVNAELSVNVISLLGDKRLYVKNMNAIRVTPRWETRRFGAYIPFLYNAQNQFWVGAAIKAGPLLLGVHNLGNVFGKKSMANGGGYIAITIRPGKRVTGEKRDRGLDCPPY
jgi:hypothetical protein